MLCLKIYKFFKSRSLRNFILSLAAVMLINSTAALAVGEKTPVPPVAAYQDIKLFQQSVQLSMPRNNTSYWFQIPDGTTLGNDCYLNLDMTISNTLINERSSISLSINGTVLETKRIYDVAKSYTGWWKVAVPASVLKVGKLNQLTIITAQRSIEGDCADIDNPSNWVRLDPDSFFHLSIQQYGSPYIGNVYPFFYDNFSDKYSIQNEYVLPQNPEASVVKDMLKVASAVGVNGKDKDLLMNKVSFGTPSDDSLRNKLYIGTVDKWTPSALFQAPQTLKVSEGFLCVQNNNMLISGKDAAGLSKAVNFFSNRTYMDQILEKQLVVDSDVKNKSTKGITLNEKGNYKLSDFGYDTINLSGAFHQSATFYLSQPGSIKSGSSSYVNVKFRHSKALLSDNSLLTVYLNNTAYDSVKLSQSNSDGGNLKVKIPEEVRNSETIQLRIEVYNYLGKIDCSKDYSDTAWTVIDKSSEIYLEPSREGISPSLQKFPYFSGLSDSGNAVVMCAPKEQGADVLNTMSILATKMGQMNEKIFDYSICSSPENISKDDKKNDMIYFGSFDNLWLPQEVSEKLAIVPLNGKFKINENLSVSPETLNGKIIFQVIRSPWNFNKKIYVVAYDKSVQAYVKTFLSDRKLLSGLDNQISVVDSHGNVKSYSFNEQSNGKDNKVPLTLQRIKYMIEKQTGISIWFVIAAIFLIIIAIASLVVVTGRRRKKRFKRAERKVRRQNFQMNADTSDEDNNQEGSKPEEDNQSEGDKDNKPEDK